MISRSRSDDCGTTSRSEELIRMTDMIMLCGDGDGNGVGDIWISGGEVGAQICIRISFVIRFRGPGSIWRTKRRPGEPQEAPNKPPRSSRGAPQEAPKRLLGGAFGSSWRSKRIPSHDPRYIHRFPSLQEPSRRSPSHDLSALSTF